MAYSNIFWHCNKCGKGAFLYSVHHHANPKVLGSSDPFKLSDPNYTKTLWARATNLSWHHTGSNVFLGALKGGTGWFE